MKKFITQETEEIRILMQKHRSREGAKQKTRKMT